MGRPRWERGERGVAKKCRGPQLEGRHWETCQREDQAGDAHWEPGWPPTHWEPPGAVEGGPAQPGLGGLPELTPELGRVAAAGQAAERSQWAAELWKATDEKRAALAALRQSEETLQQVWRQMRPPGLGPQIAAPPAASLREGTPGSPAGEDQEVEHQGRLEGEQTRAATSLLTGGATGASRPGQARPIVNLWIAT